MKKYKAEAKNLEKTHIQFIEVFLIMFHLLASRSSAASKEFTGIFIPFGQPDDKDPQHASNKADFLKSFSKVKEEEASFRSALAATIKSVRGEVNKSSSDEEKKANVGDFFMKYLKRLCIAIKSTNFGNCEIGI